MASLPSSVPTPKGNDVGDAVAMNARLLYMQGLWYDDGAPGFNLRRTYPLVSMVFSSIQACIICPTSILLYWNAKSILFENIYSVLIHVLFVTILATFYCQKEKFRKLIQQFKMIDIEKSLDNKNQILIVNEMKLACCQLTRIGYLIVIPSGTIFTLYYFVFQLFPNRMTFLIQWYPYDENKTPAYELTLVLRFLQMETVIVSGVTITTAAITIFAHLKMMFCILCDKIEHIREISVSKIEARKLEESNMAMQCEDVHEVNIRELFGEFNLIQSVDIAIDKVFRIDVDVQNFSSETENPGVFSLQRLPNCDGESVPQLRTYINKALNQLERSTNLEELIDSFATGIVEVKIEDDQKEDDSDEEATSAEIEEEMKSQLKKFVKLHQQLYGISKLVATIFNRMFLVAFVFNIVTYGVTMLNVTTAEEWTLKEVGQIWLASCAVAAFFIYNYLSNLITDQSSAVGEAMYSSDWLRSSQRFKSAMLIVMARANKPVQFKPAGINPLSLKLFGEISRSLPQTRGHWPLTSRLRKGSDNPEIYEVANHAYKLFATLQDVLK